MEQIAASLQKRSQKRWLLQRREVFGGAALQGNLQGWGHIQAAGTGKPNEFPARGELGKAPRELERIPSDSMHSSADHPKINQNPGHGLQLAHVRGERASQSSVINEPR